MNSHSPIQMTKEQVCPSAMPMSYLYQGDVATYVSLKIPTYKLNLMDIMKGIIIKNLKLDIEIHT
jgi:hypothetical protein